VHAHPVARQAAANEHDIAIETADAFSAEGEVVDRDVHAIAAPWFGHAEGHYKIGPGTSQFAEHRRRRWRPSRIGEYDTAL